MSYKEFKKVLETSPSQATLEIRISCLTDQAFKHPLLRQSLDKVRENAAHYTCHKKRKGITKTTSVVDNFLKNVKRKLRQVESFRDKDDTRILFQAMANVRNFTPFLPGAKNSHKSLFMLAQGQTYKCRYSRLLRKKDNILINLTNI